MGYTIVRRLYSSSRSLVSQARRRCDRALVILKQPAPGIPDSLARARCEREVEIRRGLDPAHVVQVLGVNQLDLILEDLGGQSLQEFLSLGPVPLQEGLTLACNLTGVIACLHQAGVLHRDISADNFIYNPANQTLKICDFDLATRIQPNGQVAPSLLEGTLAYLAPEQTGRLNNPVGFPSDLYSLGVLLYQLFSGRLPFDGQDPLRLVHSHLAVEPVPIDQIDPKVPPILSAVVQRLLAKIPATRYQSAAGLQADLQECLRQLRGGGWIESFPLGQCDQLSHFEIPSRLYGREHEAQQLLSALQLVSQGGCHVVLVAGPSGAGKSSLVRQMVAPTRGHFVSGKFDQLRSEVPCSALMEALEQLVIQLLTESEERLQQWRHRLFEQLGNNLPLIVEYLPGLERIVGNQPASTAVAPAAAQGRFLAAFQQLIQLFSTRENPLVLFLDDLQWADALTVHLLAQLAQSSESDGLLLVQAYRDQELTPGHPFHLALSQMGEVTLVQLGPLETETVTELVAASLRRSREEVAELSRIIAHKTEGNPFFVRQFLQTLHSDGHLRYSPRLGGFDFDLKVARDASITDNVAHLLAHNLQRLPPDSLRLLRLAAAMGNRFTLNALAAVTDQVLEADLQPALELGLLLPAAGPEAAYRFQHDHVQRAAYEALPAQQRPALHAEIGSMLLARLNSEQLDERLFEVVGHLNRADCPDPQRAYWAGLNARAGDKARLAAAYDLACATYRATIRLQDWSEDPELIYRVHYQLAECLRLSARIPEALEVLQQASSHVEDARRLAELEGLRMNLYQSRGDMDMALDCTRRAATLLGVDLPADSQAAVELEVDKILAWARRGPVERLLKLPELQDSRLATVMDVLTAATPVAFQADPPLGVLITVKLVALSLEHGNSLYSARAYCVLYRVLDWHNQPDIGYRFACAGRQLNRRRKENLPRSAIEFIYAYFIGPWNQPWEEVLQAFRRSYEYGLSSGDYQHMGYAAIFEVFAALLVGKPLEVVAARAELCQRTCTQLGEHSKAHFLQELLQFVGQLRGRESWERPPAGPPPTSLMMHYSRHCIELLRAFYSDDEEAVEAVLQAMRPLLPSCRGYFTEVFFYLYGGLAAAARGDLVELSSCLEWMRQQRCPANFAAPACLLEAELRRLQGQTLEAADLYDRAIALAGKHGLISLEARAHRLAGQFWLSRGKLHFSGLYLQKAHQLNSHWQASALTAELEIRHSPLLGARLERNSDARAHSSDLLNYASLARAAQAISGEIVLERLLGTLTQLVIENAGAQTGALVLDKDGRWEMQAARLAESGPVEVQGLPLSQAHQLSAGIVHYVLRTGQKVVLEDARLHSAFANDPYVRQNSPRSVFCAPIRHNSRLLGAMYLENNLLTGAFDENRLSGLEILLAQVGVSIENARLFAREREQAETLEELVSDRTRELLEANQRLRQEALTRERMENELRLAQKLQSVGQLAAGVAHEINTPMQYIQDNLEFVREVCGKWVGLDEDSEEVPEALASALEGVRRVTSIVRAMKEFSYPDQNQKSLVQLNSSIENTLVVARNEYKLVADVVTDFEPLPELLCYGGEFNQVVLNLVVNAAHAIEETGRRGQIRISTRAEREALVVEVADNGAGIPAEVCERIFDPFFTTKAVGKGSGQGLALSRSAVERQGGQLSFVSQPGQGTTFSIRLPRTDRVKAAKSA